MSDRQKQAKTSPDPKPSKPASFPHNIFMVSASKILLLAHTLSLPHTQGFFVLGKSSEPDQSSSGAAPLWLWWNCWVAFASSQTFLRERVNALPLRSYKNMFLCVCLCDRGLNREQVSAASGMESHIVHHDECQLKLSVPAWT